MCAGCVLQDQLIVCIISGKSNWTSAHLIITLKSVWQYSADNMFDRWQ